MRLKAIATARRSAARQLGFTLVECLVTCAVLSVLALLTLPSLRTHELRAGRLDAVQALHQVQLTQERHRATHGSYAPELVLAHSAQGRYRLSWQRTGVDSYTVTATAYGAQAKDSDCAALTLQVAHGFPQTGPDARCWNR